MHAIISSETIIVAPQRRRSAHAEIFLISLGLLADQQHTNQSAYLTGHTTGHIGISGEGMNE